MTLNTATVVGTAIPVILSSFVLHFMSRKTNADKPTRYLSYFEGINLVRRFLLLASKNTVEDLQRICTQSIPHPPWVKTDTVTIPEENLALAARLIQKQLGEDGIEEVGGKKWWQWRIPDSKLRAEWLEMDDLSKQRQENKDIGDRVLFYIHGGAFFLGSVDEHRYQMQKHAHKLKARSFAPRYRLAPQFPFPCGLQDCLAAYLYLITLQDPATIVMSGDSAGGGMVLSLLVILRDQGIPMPAGAMLISPWVDLTHSFPSVGIKSPLDYLPSQGFHHKPSESWPPPTPKFVPDYIPTVDEILADREERRQKAKSQIQHISKIPQLSGNEFSIILKGERVEIKDQIHLYTSNHLLLHPLVSPVMQPSLGGLPPLLILTGGAEILRDEQIYLAHKAANPSKYPPGDNFLSESDKKKINLWKPTNVQLQVWDDLCHVAPLFSFTPPAKFMYRSIAQFGTWAISKAQKNKTNEFENETRANSLLDFGTLKETSQEMPPPSDTEPATKIGQAGDPLPPFKNHMIRQKVDMYGNISSLKEENELEACTMDPSEIGTVKEAPLLNWLEARKKWDEKFASTKQRVRKQRAKKAATCGQAFEESENPPLTALIARWDAKSDA